MQVLVVSPRSRRGVPHPRTAATAAHVAALVAAGHRVRWLRPIDDALQADAVAGAEVEEFREAEPPFHAIGERFYHVPLEIRLTRWLRGDPADVVLVDGYGGVASYLTTWIANRLGSACVVVAEPLVDILCHRGTLIDETGHACDRWDEPDRCLTCCTTSFRGVPSPAVARRARWTRRLGPFATPPRLSDFENRIDMWVHGLDSADVVLVRDADGRDALERALLPMRGVVAGIPDPGDLAAWTDVYEQARNRRAVS